MLQQPLFMPPPPSKKEGHIAMHMSAMSPYDLWPTDLNINRDHLLINMIKDCLPTKFEASETKRCWTIHCTRCGRLTWPLTLTFDLLTWISIGIIYSSRTTYLHVPRGKAFLSLSCTRCVRLTWPLILDPLTWILKGAIFSSRTIYLQILKLLGQGVHELHKVLETDMTYDLDLWPTNLNIDRDNLLMEDYLSTKFEGCMVKRSWIISYRAINMTFDLDLWPNGKAFLNYK